MDEKGWGQVGSMLCNVKVVFPRKTSGRTSRGEARRGEMPSRMTDDYSSFLIQSPPQLVGWYQIDAADMDRWTF